MIGSKVGNYRITGQLGQGGMGVVYEAEDLRLKRTVALKFLPPGRMEEGQRQRFLNEAQAAARIHHPNVCPIYAIEELEGRMFIAMARLDGETIAQQIDRRGPLTVMAALDVAAQVARGLAQAHRMGIIHRDIKSSNIVVSGQGDASILDFGLAMGSGINRVTVEGGSVGTPAYMSPEQARGEDVDERTDVWSLGVVLYEMLTGRLPFGATHQAAVVNAILTQAPPPLSEWRPEAGGAVEHAVMKALEKRPQDRWVSAAEMERELHRLGAVSRTGSGMDPALVETQLVSQVSPGRWWTRRRAGMAATAIVLGAAAGLGYWRWIQPDLPEQKQIAVLPLSVVGDDAETRAIADGLVETVTAQLTELEQFRTKLMVVPASEIRSRKIASAADAKRIYGANLVVTGSAQRWGDRIQFNFTLVDAGKLRQLGARSVEYDSRHALAIRSDAVDVVGRLLEVGLTGAERRAVSPGVAPGGSAYADYLKGRGYLARYDQPGNVELALASLQKAIKADPGSALAHASLAEAYWRKALSTGDKHWGDRAQASAEESVRLDGRLAAGRVRLGEIYAGRGKQQDAIRELQRALVLSPGEAEALRALAAINVSLGRVAEAEAAYVEATKRRPTDWYGYVTLGIFYLQRARFREAEAAMKTAARLTPDNEVIHRNLAAVYLRQGRYPEARQEIEKTLKIDPKAARTYSQLGVVYYYEGRMAEAASALEAAIDIDSSSPSFWGNLGTVYRHMPGSGPKAQAALTRAVELGERRLTLTPEDGNLLSDLGEYYAKLGDRRKALAMVGRIPAENRQRYLGRVVLIYELTGLRQEAIEAVRQSPGDLAVVNAIKSDPDLTGLWKDATLQRVLSAKH